MEFALSPYALPADYGEGVVSLADMKAHLRVLQSDEDGLIALFRDAAVDMVERFCSLRLAPCEGLVWQAERLPERLFLGTGPVTALTGFSYLDSAGETREGDVSALRLAQHGQVKVLPGHSWPRDIAAGITLTFTAGFSDETRPAALVSAVKMFAAHLFVHREAVQASGGAGEIPLGFRHACQAYRLPVI